MRHALILFITTLTLYSCEVTKRKFIVFDHSSFTIVDVDKDIVIDNISIKKRGEPEPNEILRIELGPTYSDLKGISLIDLIMADSLAKAKLVFGKDYSVYFNGHDAVNNKHYYFNDIVEYGKKRIDTVFNTP